MPDVIPNDLPVLKPGHVMRLSKKGQLPRLIDGGKVYCESCRKYTGGQTESPTFWENGSYIKCNCEPKLYTLARPLYPPCPGYPEGFVIDLTGERKKYPSTLDPMNEKSQAHQAQKGL